VVGLSEPPEPDTLPNVPAPAPASLSRGTMPDPVGLFEMRRLEALSNTIFGVAMTLLAYDLPRMSGQLKSPSWADLYHTYAQHIMALMLSFIIAGMFWLSHHRRLAFAPQAGRGTVFLNLLFLLSIIVLPATNGLYGSYRTSSVVAVVYSGHLTVIAALNALLWLIALNGRRHWEILAPTIFPRRRLHARHRRRLRRAVGRTVSVVRGLCRAAAGPAGRAMVSIAQPVALPRGSQFARRSRLSASWPGPLVPAIHVFLAARR
jgi:uncharacterized membrane protein